MNMFVFDMPTKLGTDTLIMKPKVVRFSVLV